MFEEKLINAYIQEALFAIGDDRAKRVDFLLRLINVIEEIVLEISEEDL